MKHYIEQIREDHHKLTAEQMNHINNCKSCRAELTLMQKMENAIHTIPEVPLPAGFKQLVMHRVIVPVYKMWHIMAVILVSAASPALFSYIAKRLEVTDDYLLIITVILYALLIPLLILPLSNMVFRKYRDRVENFSGSIDSYLEGRSNRH